MHLLGLFLLSLALPAFSSTQIVTQIEDVDYGQNIGDEVLVLLKSGHVVKLPQSNPEILNEVQENKSSNGWLAITFDEKRFITAVGPASYQAPVIDEANFSPMEDKNDTYVPTTLPSMAKAKELFKEFRLNSKDSQCFNRAMVWSYEWWKNHSIKSNKVLVFFSRNFIRRYDFEWWFHIAPSAHIYDEATGQVVERVFDRKYGFRAGPYSLRGWTNIFTKKEKPECPIITKYSDYANNPYTGECYLYRTNMYTYQPADLEMMEAWGYKKTSFNMNEVKGAYLEAFDEKL